MGAWGAAAWENDKAADWYADTFKTTGLAKQVEAALSRDPARYPDVIRAAAHILVQLGRGYVWPVRDLQPHLALAVRQLEVVRELKEYQDAPGFVEAIDAQLADLRSRLRPPK
jgi:hypothetical protein